MVAEHVEMHDRFRVHPLKWSFNHVFNYVVRFSHEKNPAKKLAHQNNNLQKMTYLANMIRKHQILCLRRYKHYGRGLYECWLT